MKTWPCCDCCDENGPYDDIHGEPCPVCDDNGSGDFSYGSGKVLASWYDQRGRQSQG